MELDLSVSDDVESWKEFAHSEEDTPEELRQKLARLKEVQMRLQKEHRQKSVP